MSRIVLTTLLLSLLEVPFLYSQSVPKASLEITFTGIRNDQGMIAIGINISPKGWPRTPDMAPHWKKSNIRSGAMTVRIENLDYGTYAISMLDDENSNLEMDNFLGIPREGFGFSGNPRVGMSTPKFDECSFKVDQPLVKITLNTIYMGKGK
jgi:uncharacterized protein (DUF2141 family)